MGLVFWLIVVIILLTSVAAWINTKIILEVLARIEHAPEITKRKEKIKGRRHIQAVKRLRKKNRLLNQKS